MQILIRFLIGGAVVSVFALIGDVLKPKSFAGLFGAAPSVAVAWSVVSVCVSNPQTRSNRAGPRDLRGRSRLMPMAKWPIDKKTQSFCNHLT
jgi:hypothetical protein